MEPGFSVEADDARKLLRITMRGLWTVAILEDFARRQRTVIKEAGWAPGTFNSLVDLRDQAVQPRDVTERARTIIDDMNAVGPRRTAVIASGALKRMQVSRVTPDDIMRVFDTPEEALAWLAE